MIAAMRRMRWIPWMGACWMEGNFAFRWRVMGAPKLRPVAVGAGGNLAPLPLAFVIRPVNLSGYSTAEFQQAICCTAVATCSSFQNDSLGHS